MHAHPYLQVSSTTLLAKSYAYIDAILFIVTFGNELATLLLISNSFRLAIVGHELEAGQRHLRLALLRLNICDTA
jgi:hypothetical protein